MIGPRRQRVETRHMFLAYPLIPDLATVLKTPRVADFVEEFHERHYHVAADVGGFAEFADGEQFFQMCVC